jgi:gamma-glutamylcyclotransferase (GGCT)/AIG2-like uncharacterized protein YtfP
MSKRIAVYGSLKAGKYNHHMIGDSTYQGTIKVRGTLYSLGSYPALVDDDGAEYEAEVYEVSDEVYNKVAWIESAAGYKEVEIAGNIVYYADDELAEYCKRRCQVISEY